MKQYILLLLCLIVATSSVFAASQSQQAVLVPTLVNQQPDPVQPGNYVELRFRIDNVGENARDYTFNLNADYPFSFDTPADSTKQIKIGGAESGDGATVLFYRVRVDSEAVEGDNEVELEYYPTNQPGAKNTYKDTIRVESRQGLVQISDVTITPEQPQVGSRFTLDLAVQNLGSSFIENIQVSTDTDGTGFTPIGSSDKKTIRQINGIETRIVSFDFFVDADATVNVQEVPITLVYFDSLGVERTKETNIGIPVNAQPSYLLNLEQSDVQIASQKGKISVSVSNTGKGDINFVYMELLESDKYEILNSAKSYLGNLESDDFETAQFDIYVYPTDDEKVDLDFRLYYRDAYYQEFQDEFSLSNKLYSREVAQQIGLIQKSSPTGLIVVVLIIGLGVWFWIRRKKKKQNKK